MDRNRKDSGKQFIVVNHHNMPMTLADRYFREAGSKILVGSNRCATVFRSRQSARNAIRRTAVYEKNHALNWNVRCFSIVRLLDEECES